MMIPKNYVLHDFYCTKCGNKNVPLFRRKSHLHKKGHLKYLYCPYCKKRINHIECEDLLDFEKYISPIKGEFKE